ncbi:MAG TPA: cytochrome d ubiquinol oxidase subunit II [Gemmatimonadaceae bacterium]|nr:cytochrome d ubiquinol oxidase subunit II [Gemmatimonadaceae bacterium]
MSGDAGLLTLALAGVLLAALLAYVLLGGADYGGGVWDLFATGERKERQRALIADAIGPVWEANHVWLILVVVLLFTVFPPAFARLTTVLHLPLLLMLIGIVLRGTAFTFRTYDDRRSGAQRRWGLVFAIASVFTPIMLGICVGAIASGAAGESWGILARVQACAQAGDTGPECEGARQAATFGAVYVQSWLTPFALGIGVLALAMFAFLAGVYLAVESPDAALREDFRLRALVAAGATAAIAVLLPLASAGRVPIVGERLLGAWWSKPALFVTAAVAATAASALWRRRYRLARWASAGMVTLLLAGWAAAQFPLLVPPDLTIALAAAPQATQRLVAWVLGLGAFVLVPSMVYLFRVFKGRPPAFARMEARTTVRGRDHRG